MADGTDPEQVRYGVVASGPPVSPDEVETGEEAVEVVVMWGDESVLHVEHLSPPRPFHVGERSDAKNARKPDFLMSREVLGTDRMPLVVSSGTGSAVVIPEGATGEVTVGDQTTSIADLQARGQLQPCAELRGAQQYPLGPGVSAKVEVRGFRFIVKPTQAGKRVAAGASIDRRPWLYLGGSLAVSAMFLVLFHFAPPRASALNLDRIDGDSRLVDYLLEPPEMQEEKTPEWLQDSHQDDPEGGEGKRHEGEEGQMGKKESNETRQRFGIEGPKDHPDPHLAREEAKERAKTAGVLGALKAMTGAWSSPTSPYGRDTALGNDPMSALGSLMGDRIGESFGFGGLSLRSTGRGGGGTGQGTVGLEHLNTIGPGGGGGPGTGYGRGAAGFRGRAERSPPKIQSGSPDILGSLSKEVIRRTIHRRLNEVRFCYEQELRQRPDLEGRVAVKFIISPAGTVQSAGVSESTMGNARVESCVAGAVRRWNFPAPDGGGVVVVNYPFMLTSSR